VKRLKKYICDYLSSICAEEEDLKKEIELDTDFFRKERDELRANTNMLAKDREKLKQLLCQVN
jgi:hypothetical protein